MSKAFKALIWKGMATGLALTLLVAGGLARTPTRWSRAIPGDRTGYINSTTTPGSILCSS